MPTSSLHDVFTEVNLCVSDESPTLSGEKFGRSYSLTSFPVPLVGHSQKNVCYAKKFWVHNGRWLNWSWESNDSWLRVFAGWMESGCRVTGTVVLNSWTSDWIRALWMRETSPQMDDQADLRIWKGQASYCREQTLTARWITCPNGVCPKCFALTIHIHYVGCQASGL